MNSIAATWRSAKATRPLTGNALQLSRQVTASTLQSSEFCGAKSRVAASRQTSSVAAAPSELFKNVPPKSPTPAARRLRDFGDGAGRRQTAGLQRLQRKDVAGGAGGEAMRVLQDDQVFMRHDRREMPGAQAREPVDAPALNRLFDRFETRLGERPQMAMRRGLVLHLVQIDAALRAAF